MKTKRVMGAALAVALIAAAAYAALTPQKRDEPQNFIIERAGTQTETAGESSPPAPIDFGVDAPEEFKYITEGVIEAGDSFVVSFLNLQVTLNSVRLDSNIYDAGWTRDDLYLNDAMVILNGAVSDGVNMLESNIDFESGALADGLTMVTADISVKNLNSADTEFGPEANVFGNDLLYLVAARPTNQNDTGELPAYKSVACSCEKAIAGRSAWVRILPGEQVQYRLAYIADDYVPLDEGYLASYNRPMEGVCFFPLSLAERAG